jgi:penicillin-binding protein 1A
VSGARSTTTGYDDAWFTGFTPQLATSVWVGDPARQVSMRDLFGGGPVYGGTFPAPIFRQHMSGSLAGQPVAGLPGPPAAATPTATAGPPGPAPTAGRAGNPDRRRHGHG